MDLATLIDTLRHSRGFAHKADIAGAVATLAGRQAAASARMDDDRAVRLSDERAARLGDCAVRNGDDCAAIPDGAGGHLLFAIEGLVGDFVAAMPWFAGYSAVMVNLSDIAAMGGRPIAVVDALWSAGAEQAEPVLQGMAAAAERYGVPIVGGHTNQRADGAQLAVAVLGRAGPRLLTSFDARPGDALVMAVDLRGEFMSPCPFWNASTSAPAARLRDDLALLPALAEDGLCDAAKDISMAGAIGTALMLLEGSRAGGEIDLDAIPRPAGAELAHWLQAFPSFGYVLSVRPQHVAAVQARFDGRGIAAAVIGLVTSGSVLWLRQGDDRAQLWDHRAQPFVGA